MSSRAPQQMSNGTTTATRAQLRNRTIVATLLSWGLSCSGEVGGSRDLPQATGGGGTAQRDAGDSSLPSSPLGGGGNAQGEAGAPREGELDAEMDGVGQGDAQADASPPLLDEQPLPPDGGYVRVTDFGAIPDDGKDDTAALQAIISKTLDTEDRYGHPQFIYLPKGTYDVCGSLEGRVGSGGFSNGWRAGLILYGENRTGTILHVPDNCSLFADAAKPRGVLVTGSEGGGDDGSGNQAFGHYIQNLTVDIGSGNPGAVGIDYIVSNRGAIENVVVRSASRVGKTGIALTRAWPGPGLLKNITIEGFDDGVDVAHYEYGVTIEHLVLRHQNVSGIHDAQNSLHIRDLVSENSVPAIRATDDAGHIVVLDSAFSGGGPLDTAIVSQAQLLVRNSTSSGYGTFINNKVGNRMQVVGGTGVTHVAEFLSHAVSSTFDSPSHSLGLPIEETPTYPTSDGDEAIRVQDAASLQAAIDSGKPLVYLPNAHYAVDKTIVIRGSVRKIMGLQASIGPVSGKTVDPIFRFEGGGGEAVVLEHLWIDGNVEHASAKALALRHMALHEYRNTVEGTGKIFFENIIARPIRILHPQSAWARQLNCEFGTDPLVENHGGKLWILGYKTEGEMTVLKNVQGSAEVLGALFYPLAAVSPQTPLITNEEGSVSLSYTNNGGANNYDIQVRETRDGVGKDFTGAMAGRGPTLYNGYKP